MFGLGTGEFVIIGATIFLLFGAKRLPELGGAVAKSIRNFQSGLKHPDAENTDKKES
jgi:sec-independent protein translocase protein TatA